MVEIHDPTLSFPFPRSSFQTVSPRETRNLPSTQHTGLSQEAWTDRKVFSPATSKMLLSGPVPSPQRPQGLSLICLHHLAALTHHCSPWQPRWPFVPEHQHTQGLPLGHILSGEPEMEAKARGSRLTVRCAGPPGSAQ